jgi:2-polyprenyl-3-methyl-5-hydroxy-6-metoxy-1,4-benzoquinol methylase
MAGKKYYSIMTENTRQNILNKYFEFRSESLGFQDERKIQKLFNNVVKWNYKSWFKKDYTSLLEIGCYLGYTLKAIQELGLFQVIEAIEISESATQLAIRNTGLKSIYCEDAFEFLPRNQDKYDVIIMKAVLEHIPIEKTGRLLELMYNSLRKGGVVLISVPNMDWIGASHERYMDFTHETGYTLESLHNVVSMCFDSVEVKTMKYDFVVNVTSFIRIKLFQPVVKILVKAVLITLGQGAYRKTIYERSILAIGRKV